MNTKSTTVHLLFATVALGALGALASFANAGPTQYGTSAIPITTIKDAAAVKSGDTLVMVCGACKTVAIYEPVSVNSGGEDGDLGHVWLTAGSKHKCDHCGGQITVVKGKTTDSMQHNCSKCGEGAAFCCVAPVPTGKK